MTVRKDARGLPPAERFKFARHRFYASVGYQRRVPPQLRDVDGYCRIAAPDGSVFRVSPASWRRYKRGLAARLGNLDKKYLFTALTPPPGPLLDVGAHAGEFSLLALNEGRAVYAVEPDPDALACLRRNMSGKESVTVIDALVWNAEEELTFNLAAEQADSSIFGADNPEMATGTVRRRATTLDRIAEEHGIDELAFLKCDAEGAEPEALEGGRELLRRTARIAIDTGPERKGSRTSDACEALLRDAGFTAHPPAGPDRDIRIARPRRPARLTASSFPLSQHPLDNLFTTSSYPSSARSSERRAAFARSAGLLAVGERP